MNPRGGDEMGKKADNHINFRGGKVYVMQPGDRIVRIGPDLRQRELVRADGRRMKWGTFISADRAEALRKSRARKEKGK
jgi:hypothetical protein